MQNNRLLMKGVVILFTFYLSLLTSYAQNIKDGSRWWDGERLYTAYVDDAGNVRMEGESMEMGGDQFLLKKVQQTEGRYLLASGNAQGWLFIRGEVGWRVDYVRQEGMNFLAVRKPNGDCCYTLTLTPDNLKNCVAQEKIADERDVSWMLQNFLMNTHYLGRFSKPQLRLMRNEILARHGWKFQSKDLKDHFGSQPWYQPVADNSSIKLSIIEMTNIQLLKSEEAVSDENRVRYENATPAAKMVGAVDGIITVTTEEQLINALGNDRTIQVGEDVHLNLSRILEQEHQFSGIPGRAWVTIAERGGDSPVIVSEYANDGHQLTLKNFSNLVICGKKNSSIEVDPRYSFCLNFIDCENCKVENLTIGHTEGGYCDGGVIGVTGGHHIDISNCDLYGCGTYGIVARETNTLTVRRSNIHDCTYGIMELYSSFAVTFEDCDFFSNREYELITNRGCQNTSFSRCRFFANWADAPLFTSDEDITLYSCEIYHPIIGARARLKEPDNDCKWGDDGNFIPGSRKKPIGPDV